MQPNIHCNVDGKLFAAVIERQKIDMSLDLRAGFPELTLNSGATSLAPAVPGKVVVMYQACAACARMLATKLTMSCKRSTENFQRGILQV